MNSIIKVLSWNVKPGAPNEQRVDKREEITYKVTDATQFSHQKKNPYGHSKY